MSKTDWHHRVICLECGHHEGVKKYEDDAMTTYMWWTGNDRKPCAQCGVELVIDHRQENGSTTWRQRCQVRIMRWIPPMTLYPLEYSKWKPWTWKGAAKKPGFWETKPQKDEGKKPKAEPVKPENTYYKALFLYADAPIEVCEAAYKALSKTHHPDNGGNPEKMAAINEAISLIRTYSNIR
jgi:hypothetical protein